MVVQGRRELMASMSFSDPIFRSFKILSQDEFGAEETIPVFELNRNILCEPASQRAGKMPDNDAIFFIPIVFHKISLRN